MGRPTIRYTREPLTSWRAWKNTLMPRAVRHPHTYNNSTWNSIRTDSFSRASSLHKWQQPITQPLRGFFLSITKIIFKIQWICKIKIALIALTCYFKKGRKTMHDAINNLLQSGFSCLKAPFQLIKTFWLSSCYPGRNEKSVNSTMLG